jgi:hypothetical protein
MMYDSIYGGTDRLDVNVTHVGDTAQTARDIGASVLLSSGTGTGQIKIASGYVAPDWGDVANKTTTNALTGTTIATTQKVDVETIKTNPVVNGGTITFPTTATLASTTNVTAGTITTVTNLTNAPTAGDFTATMKASTLARVTLVDTATTLTNAPSDSSGVTTLLSRLSALRAGYLDNLSAGAVALEASITTVLSKLLKYVQLILRKDSAIGTDNATEKTAINANGGSGGGAFDQTTDSQEALRDRGDAAWITATGFSTHSAADIWAVGTRLLTAGTNIALAKGTGVTGFNDIAATDVVSGGAITTSGGAVSRVTLTDTVTTYTGNTPQTGDSYPKVDNEVATILTAVGLIQAKTDLIPAVPSAVGSAMTLTSGERNSVADALLDRTDGVESGLTPRQQMRLSAAADAGKTSGMDGATATIRNTADTKNRIVAAVDDDGNRTTVTLDLT